MPRLLVATVLATLMAVAPAAAQAPPAAPAPPPAPAPPAPAPAPPVPVEKRIAPGVRVAGVDVANLTLAEAAARLEPALAPAFARPVVVAVAGRRFTLTAKKMRLKFDALRSARRAYNKGKESAAGAVADVAAYVTFRRGPVRDFADRIDRQVTVAPRDATVRIAVRRIVRRRSRAGRDFNAKELRSRIEKLLADPAAARLLKPGRTTVKAQVTANALAGRYPTVLTVDRANFKLRLFKRLKLVRTYGVAVGASGYDTPRGMYSITNKAVNPAWSAPDKPWAGLYRGRVVPGGSPENPLKARWLGIANGVGIHGTGDAGSIGSRASHGCIRMRVPEVIALYNRVPVGTPVLIS